ncbi:MAG TPA: GNAT family N-acetyltransferase [Anaerolineales bacterium]|nr:GNAT family N-acetyltransferase [Anaerolineales bacterium]
MKASIDQLIQIENIPSIQGLTFRSYSGLEDCAFMAEIVNAASQADGNKEFWSVEGFENQYKVLQRSDPDRDVIFIEIDGQPVGYGRCTWNKEPDGKYIYEFRTYLKPEGRLPGIAEAMTNYFTNRIYEIAQEHPTDAPKHMQSWGANTESWYTGLLEKLDFEIIRYEFEMKRACADPVDVTPLPAGLEVRQPTPEQYRQVWEAQEEAFKDHWGFVEPTENDYQWWLNFPHFEQDRTLWKVAWDGNEVVGMVLNFIAQKENEEMNRKRGYTEFISVRKPWRRQGVARSLLTQSIQMFQEMGMEETALGVDAKNPNGALRLYESAGYQEYKRVMIYRKPMNS